MLNVSLLYSTRDFLGLIPIVGLTPDEFKSHFKTFKYSTSESILHISFKCVWTKVTNEGNIELTERGKQISGLGYKEALLIQIEDMIYNFNPVWASLLAKGRVETKNFLPADVKQCFKESGLFDDLTNEVVSFWDKIALAYRNNSQKRQVEIGRVGEKLSIEHETTRTGVRPLWQALESNASGFDLLSITDSQSKIRMQIEVKASTSKLSYANIHITRNEWNVALNSNNYIFHLWLIDTENTLYKVSVDTIGNHIPKNYGNGNWESVIIPFTSLI